MQYFLSFDPRLKAMQPVFPQVASYGNILYRVARSKKHCITVIIFLSDAKNANRLEIQRHFGRQTLALDLKDVHFDLATGGADRFHVVALLMAD